MLISGPVSCDNDTGQCSALRAIPVEAPPAGAWGPINWAILAVILAALLLVTVPPLLAAGAARRSGS